MNSLIRIIALALISTMALSAAASAQTMDHPAVHHHKHHRKHHHHAVTQQHP